MFLEFLESNVKIYTYKNIYLCFLIHILVWFFNINLKSYVSVTVLFEVYVDEKKMLIKLCKEEWNVKKKCRNIIFWLFNFKLIISLHRFKEVVNIVAINLSEWL